MSRYHTVPLHFIHAIDILAKAAASPTVATNIQHNILLSHVALSKRANKLLASKQSSTQIMEQLADHMKKRNMEVGCQVSVPRFWEFGGRPCIAPNTLTYKQAEVDPVTSQRLSGDI